MKALLAAIFVLLSVSAHAWDENLQIPERPSAPVTDEFGLLSNSEQDQINRWLAEIRRRSGVEIAVYVPKTLQGREVADFSIAVAERWGLGRKKTDKGLLFVVAPKERKMRFEVGYGLEGEITDAYSRRVLDDQVRPYFADGRYGDGIAAGIAAIAQKAGVQRELVEAEAPVGTGGPSVGLILLIIFLFVVATFLRAVTGMFGWLPRGSYRRYGGWHGGGGFGGSLGGGRSSGGFSWGGGGGGFGGGGASSSW